MSDLQQLREKVKHLKILFVDDEKAIRGGTGVFLRKFFDTVVVSCDGLEGLEVFKKHGDFDVLITDIMMPKMDGLAMTKEIKKIDPDIFVIFLTASRSIDDVQSSLSDLTLQKPFSFDDVTIVMNRLGEMKC